MKSVDEKQAMEMRTGRSVLAMAWSHRKNARHSNPQKYVREAVCNKTQRKNKNEMAG
jgi:hypothetical protein